MTIEANEGKSLEIEVDGVRYQRIPIRTKLVMPEDSIDEIVLEGAEGRLQPGDIFVVTEKIVAITQGRSFPIDSIKPRRLARFLSRFVTRKTSGIGLRMPETMEMALRECGTPRILFAAMVAAVTKLFGRKGDFYRIAGYRARSIDGPTSYTIPPYNEAVVLGPLEPKKVAAHFREITGAIAEVAVIDINDIGGNILGSTLSKDEEKLLVQIMRDNPLGQKHQSTPLAIIRRTTGEQPHAA